MTAIFPDLSWEDCPSLISPFPNLTSGLSDGVLSHEAQKQRMGGLAMPPWAWKTLLNAGVLKVLDDVTWGEI